MFIELIKNYIRIGITSQFFYNTHTFSIRFITKIRNTINSFFFDQICNFFY